MAGLVMRLTRWLGNLVNKCWGEVVLGRGGAWVGWCRGGVVLG